MIGPSNAAQAHSFSATQFCRSSTQSELLALSSYAMNTTSNVSMIPPRWELARTQADIDALKSQFNLLQVTSKPTLAAFHPGWPQTSVTFVFLIYIVLLVWRKMRGASSYDSEPRDNLSWEQVNRKVRRQLIKTIAIPVVTFLAWAVSFGLMHRNLHTAGWNSVTDWVFWVFVTFALYKEDEAEVPFKFFVAIIGVQWTASLYLIIQRWIGNIGSIAYEILDSNGCTSHRWVAIPRSRGTSTTIPNPPNSLLYLVYHLSTNIHLLHLSDIYDIRRGCR